MGKHNFTVTTPVNKRVIGKFHTLALRKSYENPTKNVKINNKNVNRAELVLVLRIGMKYFIYVFNCVIGSLCSVVVSTLAYNAGSLGIESI